MKNRITPELRHERNLTAWAALAGLALLAALAGPFFVGHIYTADDLGAFHLPVRAFYAEQLARGEAFDWMPSIYSGFYLTGEGQAGVYHPLHQLLYRLLPLRAALAWEYLLPYPLMMVGMWLLLRRRHVDGAAGAIGALLFAFSSFNLLHFVHPNAVAVVAHIPWLLWAIDIVLTDARRRRVMLASALIALLTGSQLLLGYPQFVWLSLLAEACYAVFLIGTNKYGARTGCDLHHTCADCIGCATQTWPRLVIAKGVGLLLGGVQLIPTMDAWFHSTRASADGYFSAWGSLHPLNLLQLAAPYMFGNRVVGDNTHEYGLYIGAAPLLLIAWLIVRRRELGLLKRLAWAAFAFGIAAILLTFGGYGPLHEVVSRLPLVGAFRFPCRYLILFQLACAVLAAIGFLLLSRECELARKNRSASSAARVDRWRVLLMTLRRLWRDFEPLWCVVVVSAVMAAIGLWLRYPPLFGSVAAILAGPLLMIAAAVLIVLAARGHRAALAGIILFAAADLGFYGMSYSIYPSNDSLAQFVASAQTPPGDPDGRVVGDLLRFDEPGLRTGDLMTLGGWQRADGYAGLSPSRRLDYGSLAALRVAGVRWVRRHQTTDAIAGPEPWDDSWLRVPDPLPRTRLVSRTQSSDSPATDISTIDIETTALVDVPLRLPISEPGEVVITDQRPGRIEIEATCPAKQLLVVAESHHPGWRATLDGRPRTVLRVNGDFIGCLAEAGRHKIVFEFQPESLQRGWMATYLGLCLVSLCFLGLTVRPETRLPEDCP